ncbi:MAG: hypothetical protein JW891_04470 [Candidatus Lokiarchaeota archaeon]|nr:hypothetical protein [Candidatus Lokiarchaeota archaeon]
MVKRERQRYILFKIISENIEYLDQNEFLKSIWSSIWRFFGMKEANKIGLWLVDFKTDPGYGIIRCAHITKELIITALTLITEINGKRIIISPLKTSGTIKTMNKYKTRFF